MEPRIEILTGKRLVGQRMSMTMADDKTPVLWKQFMSRRKEIPNKLTEELVSMQVYDQAFDFSNYNIHRAFEKWAAVEVSGFEAIPADFEKYILPSGLYAVFLHKGGASTGPKTFQYIFGAWLPGSDYLLDHRPHFEILGEKYKNDSPDSEEEIWIPIRPKTQFS